MGRCLETLRLEVGNGGSGDSLVVISQQHKQLVTMTLILSLQEKLMVKHTI